MPAFFVCTAETPPPNLPLKKGEGQIGFAVGHVSHQRAPPPSSGGGWVGVKTYSSALRHRGQSQTAIDAH